LRAHDRMTHDRRIPESECNLLALQSMHLDLAPNLPALARKTHQVQSFVISTFLQRSIFVYRTFAIYNIQGNNHDAPDIIIPLCDLVNVGATAGDNDQCSCGASFVNGKSMD
jgi:hypothetical protein